MKENFGRGKFLDDCHGAGLDSGKYFLELVSDFFVAVFRLGFVLAGCG